MPIQILANSKLITGIFPKGGGKRVIEALHNRGITTANMYFARGSDFGAPLGKSGIPEQVEKEIVTVVVSPKESDEMFEFIYDTADINRPGAGVIYMGELRKSVPFVLPDLSSQSTEP